MKLTREVVHALERSRGHRVIPDVCAAVAAHLGVRADLWLVDYRQEVLQQAVPSADGRRERMRVEGSFVGRCFASQVVLRKALDTGEQVLLPVSSRGERLGVLELDGACPLEPDQERELAALLPLFAQSLASLGTVGGHVEQVRRAQPLTVAAELQWSLLPGTAYQDDDLTVAGMLEPAYSVAGDAFDWTRDGEVLHLAVLDGTGRGVPAALATTLAVSALRNARFSGTRLSDQAALADQAVFSHHGGEVFVSALVMQADVARGQLRVVDAGSPQLHLLRDGKTTLVELEAQLPLGMFDETIYTEQVVDLLPGDRLVIVSDGVHGTRTRAGADFGDSLVGVFRDCRLLSPGETVRHVLQQLHREHHREDLSGGLDDDALVVCLDWHPATSRDS